MHPQTSDEFLLKEKNEESKAIFFKKDQTLDNKFEF